MSYTFTKCWCLTAHNAPLTYLAWAGRSGKRTWPKIEERAEENKPWIASTQGQKRCECCTRLLLLRGVLGAHLLKNKEPGARKRELGVWGRAELPRCEWRQRPAIKSGFITELMKGRALLGLPQGAKQSSSAGAMAKHQCTETGGEKRGKVQPKEKNLPQTTEQQCRSDGRTSMHRNQGWETGRSPAKGENLSTNSCCLISGCLITLSQCWQHHVGLWEGSSAWQRFWGEVPVALCPLAASAGGWISTWLLCQGGLGRAEGTEGWLSTKGSSPDPFLLWFLHAGSKSQPFSHGLMQFWHW